MDLEADMEGPGAQRELLADLPGERPGLSQPRRERVVVLGRPLTIKNRAVDGVTVACDPKPIG